MKIAVTILVLALCHCTLYAQRMRQRTDLEILKLHGKVQAATSTTYKADTTNSSSIPQWANTDSNVFNTAGNLLRRSSVNADTNQNFTKKYTYDQSGKNMLSDTTFDKWGMVDEATIYTYDSMCNEVNAMQRNSADDDGTWTNYLYTNIYDNTHKLLRGYISNGNNDTGFDKGNLSYANFYDDKGRLRKHESYRDDSTLSYISEYDVRGVEIKSTYGNGWYIIYAYDNKGNCTLNSNFSPTGAPGNTTHYEYDRYGNETMYKTLNDKGEISRLWTRAYSQIDKYGNWRKMNWYVNCKLVQYTVRDITYYGK